MYIYIYIYIVGIYVYMFRYLGFQGYCLKDAVKGPQFEETNTQIFLSHTFLE